MSVPTLKILSLYRRFGSHRSLLVVVLSLLCLLFVLYSSSGPLRIRGASTSESKAEPIYPRPDGSKDYNLRKDGTTNFNGFSFYLMGDTPVSPPLLCLRSQFAVSL
jgi:hypothetical protein